MEPQNGMMLHIKEGVYAHSGLPAHDGNTYVLHDYDEESGWGWASLPGDYPYGYAVHRDAIIPVEVDA